MFPLYHPVLVDLEIRAQVPTHEGPVKGSSLLDSLRKGRFPFFMPSPTAESGIKLSEGSSAAEPQEKAGILRANAQSLS
jgi:hypothetical protein